MQLYQQPVRQLMKNAAAQLPRPFTRNDIVRWFSHNYPLVKKKTVINHVYSCCVNCPHRTSYRLLDRNGRPIKNVLYRRPDGLYEKYDPNKHGQ